MSLIFRSGEHQQSYRNDCSHTDNIFCRTQLYGLVWNLHRVGIVHGDLEPRNIARVPGGGFRLIDFSESMGHTCVETSVRYMVAPFT